MNKKLVKTLLEKKDGYVYHATKTSNVSKIKKKGILPLQTSNWKKGSGERYGKAGEIFVFEDPTDATRWAANMDWEFFQETGSGKISVVKLKKTGKWSEDKNDPLSHLGAKGKWLKRKGFISPEDIVSVTPITLDITRRLSADYPGDVSDVFE